MDSDWLPMTRELQNVLSEHRRTTRSMLVFPAPTGEPYQKRQNFMPGLCAAAGVKPFGVHAIRHLTASILAGSGIDLVTIQIILRHKNALTTTLYLKSLGIKTDALDEVFSNRKALPKVVSLKRA